MYIHVMFSITDGHVWNLSVLHDLHAGWVTGVCGHRYILFSVCCLYPLLLQTATHSMIALWQKLDLKQMHIEMYCYELPAIGTSKHWYVRSPRANCNPLHLAFTLPTL